MPVIKYFLCLVVLCYNAPQHQPRTQPKAPTMSTKPTTVTVGDLQDQASAPVPSKPTTITANDPRNQASTTVTGPGHATPHGIVEPNQEQVTTPVTQAPAPAPVTQAPAPVKQAAPVHQAYKCVHPHGLNFNGTDYKTGQRYVFAAEDLYEGGWLDSQIKAKLFEPVE